MAHNHRASQDVGLTPILATSGKPHSPTLVDLHIQDRGYHLRRIPLLRRWVNKGRKKDRAALEGVSWRARLNEKMSDESQRCVCAGRDRCSDWFGNETPARFMGARCLSWSCAGLPQDSAPRLYRRAQSEGESVAPESALADSPGISVGLREPSNAGRADGDLGLAGRHV